MKNKKPYHCAPQGILPWLFPSYPFPGFFFFFFILGYHTFHQSKKRVNNLFSFFQRQIPTPQNDQSSQIPQNMVQNTRFFPPLRTRRVHHLYRGTFAVCGLELTTRKKNLVTSRMVFVFPSGSIFFCLVSTRGPPPRATGNRNESQPKTVHDGADSRN